MTTLNRTLRGTMFRSFGLVALVVAACADQSARTQPPQRAQLARAVSTPPTGGEPPTPLSPAARAILKDRMAMHERDMSKLVSAIMLLDYPSIVERANGIAADVNLSRPVSDDATELNASLPENFFLRQDELRAGARELAAAANALDPYRVANAYGRLSEGCVRCHADYRPRTAH